MTKRAQKSFEPAVVLDAEEVAKRILASAYLNYEIPAALFGNGPMVQKLRALIDDTRLLAHRVLADAEFRRRMERETINGIEPGHPLYAQLKVFIDSYKVKPTRLISVRDRLGKKGK